MAFVHRRWDARGRVPVLGEAGGAACAEPLDGPPRQNEVLREVGKILAVLLGTAALANWLLNSLGAG